MGAIVAAQQASVLPGVSLTLSAPPVKKTVVTAGDGSYHLVDLVPGTYVVTAQLAGFATLVRENVVVREGLNLTLDLTMTVGAISETVEVRADTPLLESKTAAQGVNISGDLQRALPLSSLRTWADALTLVPGVTTSQARFQTYLNADNTPGGQSLTVMTRQADSSLGGPAVRGKVWFFGTARIARNATGNPQNVVLRKRHF